MPGFIPPFSYAYVRYMLSAHARQPRRNVNVVVIDLEYDSSSTMNRVTRYTCAGGTRGRKAFRASKVPEPRLRLRSARKIPALPLHTKPQSHSHTDFQLKPSRRIQRSTRTEFPSLTYTYTSHHVLIAERKFFDSIQYSF